MRETKSSQATPPERGGSPDLPWAYCVRCGPAVTHRAFADDGSDRLVHRCLRCDAVLGEHAATAVSYADALRLGVGLPEDVAAQEAPAEGGCGGGGCGQGGCGEPESER